LAKDVLGMPVQISQPKNIIGMVDQLDSPAYATSVGLLRWAVLMSEFVGAYSSRRPIISGENVDWMKMKDWLRRLLP
jgi:cell division protein FtsA